MNDVFKFERRMCDVGSASRLWYRCTEESGRFLSSLLTDSSSLFISANAREFFIGLGFCVHTDGCCLRENLGRFCGGMAEVKKYAPVNGGVLFADFGIHFSVFRTKRTVAIVYGFVFVFIAFSIFLAFSPSSSNSSAPWFTNVFASSTADKLEESYGSRFSSIFSYFFANSSSVPEFNRSSRANSAGSRSSSYTPDSSNAEISSGKNLTQIRDKADKVEILEPNNSTVSPQKFNNDTNPPKLIGGLLGLKNQTQKTQFNGKGEVLKQNQSQSEGFDDKVGALKVNQSTTSNKTANSSVSGLENGTVNPVKAISELGIIKNFTSSLMKKQNNGTDTGDGKQSVDLIKSLANCNLFDGNWVRDESYPLYSPGSCPLIDDQFNCFLNGRRDNGYHKLKWKPKGCNLPRLNGSHMLELLRGKRLVFVGDSLNRNMWESLICILKNSAKDQKKVYEESGRHHFRTEPSYAFIFEDYKCRVEFFVSPFLVQESEVRGKNGTKETLRLDLMGRSADKYKNADIIVFNTGHWWTHEKTSKGKDYYQEGSHVYRELDVTEAFRKALTTWGRWIDANVDPTKSLVFFRGYSASHFSGGQWNSGGQCDHETEPIKDDKYLALYPPKMATLERIFKGMKSRVTYLNVTRMTDYRKDGHPSHYRKQHTSDLSFQDCSHWCLPGVPDTWNEILYAELLVKLNQMHQ